MPFKEFILSAKRTKTFRRIYWVALGLVLFVAAPAQADQTATELPDLFEKLVVAESASEAKQIESAIWGHWLLGPDDSSDQLMTQIQLALRAGRNEVGLLLCNQLWLIFKPHLSLSLAILALYRGWA